MLSFVSDSSFFNEADVIIEIAPDTSACDVSDPERSRGSSVASHQSSPESLYFKEFGHFKMTDKVI